MGDGPQPCGGERDAEAESPGRRCGGGDPHDGSTTFAGMRFLLIPPPGQERSLVEGRIVAMGGQVLGPLEYRSCTHVCMTGDFVEGLQDALRREGKEPVGHGWVNEHFGRNKLLLDDLQGDGDGADGIPCNVNVIPSTSSKKRSMSVLGSESDDETDALLQGNGNGNDADGICDVISSTSKKRPMSVLGSESSSSSGRSVKRMHCCVDGDEFEEMMHRRHHALFLCKLDRSQRISLHDYAAQMQSRLRVTVAVPGSRNGQTSTSTEPEVILIVRKAHTLLRCLHDAGLTLAGKFSAKNFLIGEVMFRRKDIVFGHLPSGTLKWCSDPADEELDLARFDKMIRRELFIEHIVPHDLNVWLSLINEKGFEELLPDHISLMEAYQSVSALMSLCYNFQAMEHKDPEKRGAIVSELGRYYSDWKRLVNDPREGNSYLQETLRYVDPSTNRMECYEDDLRGLLRLVMDYCDRAETWGTVALIVGQNFPNLLSDVQEKMYKAGY